MVSKWIMFSIVVLATVLSCGNEVQDLSFWQVQDITKSEDRIALLVNQDPDVLNIYIKGETDGTFQVVANGQTDNKIFEFRGGLIDTVVSQYWKSPTCKTIYVPKSVKSGSLQISTLIYPKK